MKKALLFLFALSLIFSACEREECDEPVPEITYQDFIRFGPDSADFWLNFKDCDGDFGMDPEDIDTLTEDSTGRYNLFMDYLYFMDSTWHVLLLDIDSNGRFYYTVPRIENRSISNTLEGDIKIDMSRGYYFPTLGTHFKYRVYVVDRAKNKSNVIETPTQTIQP